MGKEKRVEGTAGVVFAVRVKNPGMLGSSLYLVATLLDSLTL